MTRITASEAFVEQLVAEGVTDVFGIVGSAYMDALDLFEPAGIRFLSVAHEQNAAHMADGYARATNRHGICIGQNGPGITNFVTAIAAAYWAHSPVVAITPETGSASMGLGGFQETNQLPIFSGSGDQAARRASPPPPGCWRRPGSRSSSWAAGRSCPAPATRPASWPSTSRPRWSPATSTTMPSRPRIR
jgi:2-succinyl-5-enolpyruvyl-6-hydroxy-3-cyclohexene-1-carboxylate synthase